MGIAVVVVALTLLGAYQEWIGESPEFGRCAAEIAKITPGMSEVRAQAHVDRANGGQQGAALGTIVLGSNRTVICRRFRHGYSASDMWKGEPDLIDHMEDGLLRMHRALFGDPDFYLFTIRFANGAVSAIETESCLAISDTARCETRSIYTVSGRHLSP